MNLFIFLICATVVVAQETQLLGECDDANAEIRPCGDPCPITCENMNRPREPCPDICLMDQCACLEGYVLNDVGKCVSPDECPSTTQCPGENEEYQACGGHCFHDADCNSYVHGIIMGCPPPPRDEDTPMCYPRCVCKMGFVRINERCVLPTACCPSPSTRLVDCPAPCERNCTFTPAATCIENCPMRKCVCAPNYVRSGNICIPETNCPRPCGVNEVYVACKDPCPKTCASIISMAPPLACLPPNPCPGGCNCIPGHVRNSAGACVPISSCPCPDRNAFVTTCPNPCPPTCDSPSGQLPCTRTCVATGCTCRPGFVLSEIGGRCIRERLCAGNLPIDPRNQIQAFSSDTISRSPVTSSPTVSVSKKTTKAPTKKPVNKAKKLGNKQSCA